MFPDRFTPAPIFAGARTPRRAAPFLPMSRAEMAALGWDECDVILVTGDAYVDHPSFGMAFFGRLLEAHGLRVGIISQPDWTSAEPFRALGRPRLFFGITAGNMDSMVNRYTSDRKIRSEDAYTPNAEAGRRPDRAVIVYAQRAREAFPDAAVVIGSIEASLRRIAHYDYWSDTVRRSVLADSKADLLLFGNAERALVALARRLAAGEAIGDIRDLRGTAFMVRSDWLPGQAWQEIDSSELDRHGHIDPHIDPHPDPYAIAPAAAAPTAGNGAQPVRIVTRAERLAQRRAQREHTEPGPLSKMMKPGIGIYQKFRELFDKYSKEAGKKQHLVPYFIAAHPGTTDRDMVNLALWLKKNGFRPDQVQTSLPTPMALATTMYHSRKNPLKKVSADSESVHTARAGRARRLHKALLRWHDPQNWPLIRAALLAMGRRDLIGNRPDQLVPWQQPPIAAGQSGAHPAASRRRGPGQPTQGKTGSRSASAKPDGACRRR